MSFIRMFALFTFISATMATDLAITGNGAGTTKSLEGSPAAHIKLTQDDFDLVAAPVGARSNKIEAESTKNRAGGRLHKRIDTPVKAHFGVSGNATSKALFESPSVAAGGLMMVNVVTDPPLAEEKKCVKSSMNAKDVEAICLKEEWKLVTKLSCSNNAFIISQPYDGRSMALEEMQCVNKVNVEEGLLKQIQAADMTFESVTHACMYVKAAEQLAIDPSHPDKTLDSKITKAKAMCEKVPTIILMVLRDQSLPPTEQPRAAWQIMNFFKGIREPTTFNNWRTQIASLRWTKIDPIAKLNGKLIPVEAQTNLGNYNGEIKAFGYVNADWSKAKETKYDYYMQYPAMTKEVLNFLWSNFVKGDLPKFARYLGSLSQPLPEWIATNFKTIFQDGLVEKTRKKHGSNKEAGAGSKKWLPLIYGKADDKPHPCTTGILWHLLNCKALNGESGKNVPFDELISIVKSMGKKWKEGFEVSNQAASMSSMSFLQLVEIHASLHISQTVDLPALLGHNVEPSFVDVPGGRERVPLEKVDYCSPRFFDQLFQGKPIPLEPPSFGDAANEGVQISTITQESRVKGTREFQHCDAKDSA